MLESLTQDLFARRQDAYQRLARGEAMLFLRKDEVLDLQRALIDHFGGRHGLRDEGALDSALLAAVNRQHYEDANLAVCAATSAYHLTRNHPFTDGNKRIGGAPIPRVSPNSSCV